MTADKIRLNIYLTIFAILLSVGILGFMWAEDLCFTDAVYFSVVTMSTVGYGDIHPQSAAGKILALIMIVGGVGTFLGVVASITDLLVNRREELHRRQKLNMVMGVFFSEVGTDLLKRFCLSDPSIRTLHEVLKVTSHWKTEDYRKAENFITAHPFSLEAVPNQLRDLRSFLQTRSEFLLRLLENPILQEQGNFTRLLQAIFHLRDELIHRSRFEHLPPADQRHLEGDMARVYKLLVAEWLTYMNYLHQHYDYLLSLAMRRNPFDPEASVVVEA